MPTKKKHLQRLSPEQAAFKAFVKTYIKVNEISPSYQEIADGLKIPMPSVQKYIEELSAVGAITRIPKIPRSIRVVGN